MYIGPSITIIINLFFHLLWRPLDINIFTKWEIFAGWATIDGKKKLYTYYEKNINWKKYIGISNFEPPFNPTLVRSYRGRRLQLRPALKRCVSDVFLQSKVTRTFLCVWGATGSGLRICYLGWFRVRRRSRRSRLWRREWVANHCISCKVVDQIVDIRWTAKSTYF